MYQRQISRLTKFAEERGGRLAATFAFLLFTCYHESSLREATDRRDLGQLLPIFTQKVVKQLVRGEGGLLQKHLSKS